MGINLTCNLKETLKSTNWGRNLIKRVRYLLISINWIFVKLICIIPSKHVRRMMLNAFKGVNIAKGVPIYSGFHWWQGPLEIQSGSSIGFNNHFDCRRGIYVGKNVDFASDVCIWTLHHDYNSVDFHDVGGPVHIGDFAWICSHSIILPGVTIGEGAVVASGAVVSRDVEAYTVVGGIPAKKIGSREKKNYNYSPAECWIPFF